MRLFPPLVLAVSTAAATAQASTIYQRARLVYALDANVAPNCPNVTELHKAVSQRLGYDPFWDWAEQTIIVLVWRDHGQFAGRVVNVDPQGRSTTRDIPADEACSQIVGAAALAISIALDMASPPPSTTTESHPSDSPAPPTAAPAPAPPPEVPAEPMAIEAPNPEATPSAPRFGVGAGASAFVGIAPKPGAGAAAFAEARRGSFSLGAEAIVAAAASTDNVQPAVFAAELAPCARLGPTFLCALGELGWVQAWDVGDASGGSDGAPFVALGGRAGVDIPLSADVFTRLQGDVLVEAFGPRFAAPTKNFGPYSAVQASTMPAALGGAIGLLFGVHLQ